MKDANTRLIIYNVLGEKVKELINGYLFQGTYSVEWNGTNDDLQAVPSGVYLIKMTTDAADIQTDQTFSALRKMLLLK
jgi:flagellar hook assembly protein FlgD